MNAVAQVVALLQAVIYIAVFPLESFLLPRTRSGRFLSPTRTPDTSHHWSTR